MDDNLHMRPAVQYLFSSPEGDISLGADDLARPFLLSAGVEHGELTLGDYFKALEKFIHTVGNKKLSSILADHCGENQESINIKQIVLRSEKHGLLYHISSAEFFLDKFTVKLAISTALTEQGKRCLERDYSLQSQLQNGENDSFVPRQHFLKEMVIIKNIKEYPLIMTLSQWLDGYHEWHISYNKKINSYQIIVWDDNKNTFISQSQSMDLFEKAAFILTYYFDPETSRQVYPWHHAAGDFIVKPTTDTLDVKLITVRDIFSIGKAQEGRAASPLANCISFFLHLSIRMRIDKIDGVGDSFWLDNYVVSAVIKGFFAAYSTKNMQHIASSKQFKQLLQAFNSEDFMGVCQPLLDFYRDESTEDFRVVIENLEEHLTTLVEKLREL